MASEIETQLQDLAKRLEADFAELFSLLGGYPAPQARAAAQPLQVPGLRVPAGIGAPVAVPPLIKPSASASISEALSSLFEQGVRLRPFTGHRYFIASEAVNQTANTTQIGRTVDEVLVSPTIDAQIEFDTEIANSTPTVYGGTVIRHPARTTYVQHRAISSTLSGQLLVWAYWS